ncbi:MAG: aldehyde dehydrogenase family protein, partial [Antricoccus sp.]
MTDTLPTRDDLADRARIAAAACGVDLSALDGEHQLNSPINGASLYGVHWSSADEVDKAVGRARAVYAEWRRTPAPVRGALVKRFGELLSEHKRDLGAIVSIEVGKITSEAEGEVQEMIDICDFAVGLSRQLYGRSIVSERPGHRLTETWHPLGVVGVISAFNFPVAVWSWNTALALVCGDPVIWKPSEAAPLCALASAALMQQAIRDVGAPTDLSQVIIGDGSVGEALVAHRDVALISATGSTRMGKVVGPLVADRFGRSLLELGGNNAAIVSASADLDLTVRGIVFSAAGTAGQRCTTMRRVIAHESVSAALVDRLVEVYAKLPIGDPMTEGTLVGPLINEHSYQGFTAAIEQAKAEGGTVVAGGQRALADAASGAYYVQPTIITMPAQSQIVRSETFAPILYVLTYTDFAEAITLNNDVPQGLSSSVFTQDQAEAERFVSPEGSDCGIANV